MNGACETNELRQIAAALPANLDELANDCPAVHSCSPRRTDPLQPGNEGFG